MGDVNRSYQAPADKAVDGLDEEISVREIKSLAGLVQHQQAWTLHQRASQENNTLNSGRELKQWPTRKFQQLELSHPLSRGGALGSGRFLIQADRFLKAREHRVEAGYAIVKMEL